MTAQDPGSGPAPSPAPGWYPGPRHAQPYGPPPPPRAPAAAPALTPRWAWALIAAGAAWVPLAALVAYMSGGSWTTKAAVTGGLVAADIMASAFAVADVKAIRRAGCRAGSALLALLFSPVIYLLVRAAHLKGARAAWGIFAAGLAVWAVAGVLAYPAASTVAEHTARLDSARLQQQIEQGVQRQGGIKVTASCPHDPPATPGTSFQCVITAADGSTAVVDVTVQPDQSLTWQVRK